MSAVAAFSQSRGRLDRRWIEVGLWAAMGFGLALCYIGHTLPIMTAGLLLLGVLALLRPDLALLLVALTAPLFLVPLVTPTGGRQIALPPHELALLVSAAAALPNLLVHAIGWPSPPNPLSQIGRGGWGVRARGSILLHVAISRLYQAVVRHLPEALLLIAGLAGIYMAVPEQGARADALRAFRWFVAEPLIFVALIRAHALWPPAGAPTSGLAQARRLLNVFMIGGVAVALLGALQPDCNFE